MRVAAVAIAMAAVATAGGEIHWLERDFDFGVMKEAAGPKTGKSRFVNTGRDTLTIVDVRPSCGCTSATFTDTPIAPGDTACVEYTYDPAFRPGRFAKSVRVSLSDGSRYSIKITGAVLGTPESLDKMYPVEAGAVRLTESVIPLGEVRMGETPSRFFSIYNQEADSVWPQAISPEKALKVERHPGLLGPGDIITYGVYFDTKRLGQYGPVELPVRVIADSLRADSGEATVTVRATIVPDFRFISATQEKNAPHFLLEQRVVDLGDVDSPTPREFEFTIINDGRSPLELRRLYSDEGVIEPVQAPKMVKKGKRARVKARLLAGRMPAGPFRTTLKIITNDPRNGVAEVPVCGIITDTTNKTQN